MKHRPTEPDPFKPENLEAPVYPLIRCVQEIPCNPCTEACPQNLISMPGSILALPEFSGECQGCGRCVLACPGLAIQLVINDYDPTGEMALVMLPFEFTDDTAPPGLEVTTTDMEGEVPEESYGIPFGVANLVREGTDVTVVAVGKMVNEAAHAADELKGKVSVEVIDPRTLVPFDEETILRSVAKTGRLVVVDEDYERCGFSAEVAAVVAEKGFHNLKAPVARVANPNVPLPFNRNLENHVLPSAVKIVRAMKNVMKG